jgi:hypothetical protein
METKDSKQNTQEIWLTNTGLVVFSGADDTKHVFSSLDDLIPDNNKTKFYVKGDYLLEFTINDLTLIDVNGVTTAYTVINEQTQRNTPSLLATKFDAVLDQLANEVFRGCCPSSGGGGGPTTVPILDSSNALAGTADAALSENVKMMDASMSLALVGSQWQVSNPPVPMKARPISVQCPTGTTPLAPNDFIQNFNDGIYDFWTYTGSVQIKRLGANKYTLDAGNPNPWGGTSRYTSTDGTPPSVGAYFTSYGTGEPYLVCDWLHDVMFYVSNLGNLNHAATLAQCTTLNGLLFKGFDDWFVPCLEIFINVAYPDPTSVYYNSPNMLQRGIVSGYNESTVWLSRVCEISSANAMAFYSAYDWRRANKTSSSNHAGYICRTIKSTDPYLP